MVPRCERISYGRAQRQKEGRIDKVQRLFQWARYSKIGLIEHTEQTRLGHQGWPCKSWQKLAGRYHLPEAEVRVGGSVNPQYQMVDFVILQLFFFFFNGDWDTRRQTSVWTRNESKIREESPPPKKKSWPTLCVRYQFLPASMASK